MTAVVNKTGSQNFHVGEDYAMIKIDLKKKIKSVQHLSTLSLEETSERVHLKVREEKSDQRFAAMVNNKTLMLVVLLSIFMAGSQTKG